MSKFQDGNSAGHCGEFFFGAHLVLAGSAGGVSWHCDNDGTRQAPVPDYVAPESRRGATSMSETLVWVVGGGGSLGSHLRRVLGRHIPNARVWGSVAVHFSWTDAAKLTLEFDRTVAAFADAVRRGAVAWSVLWCAGKGVMSSSADALEPEWLAWKRLLELLGYHLPGFKAEVSGSIFFASSAGGVYGGNVGQNLTEHTATQPASDYGAHKVRMEEALRNWSATFPRHSCLIGRISSLYGPGRT